MQKLKDLLTRSQKMQDLLPKTEFFNLGNKSEYKKLENLLKNRKEVAVIDDFEEQLRELFLSRNPHFKTNPLAGKEAAIKYVNSKKINNSLVLLGRWIYLPWINTLIHVLEKEDFFELRTARNRNLITKEEQDLFGQARIGVGGMSVGNSVAVCLAMEGVNYLRLADFDRLALSNLNRIRAGVQHLGLNKAIIAARQILELNPYAQLDIYADGLTDKALGQFISGPPRLDILIDEMDDVVMKLKMRVWAKKMKIPIISAADNGDNAILDVERYDLEPKLLPFHGLLGNIDYKKVEKMNFAGRIKLINDMVGLNYVTSRMKSSLLKVGTELYSWPQLGGAAALSGSVITYVARKIIIGEEVKSGKYDISLDSFIVPGFNSSVSKKGRIKETREFLKTQEKTFKT